MANATSRAEPSSWAIVGLVASLAFAVWWRGHTFAPTVLDLWGAAPWPVVEGATEPLDCDEAAYAYMGRRMAAGDRLYADLSENKPPLGYWIYGAAVALGGPTELAIRVLPIPLVMGTVALVWWIGSRLGGSLSAGVSALLAVLLSTDPYLYGNGAQLEQAINVFAVGALAATIAAGGASRGRGAWLLVAGVSLGLATLVKQVAAAHLVVLGAAALAIPRNEGKSGRGRSLGLLVAGFAAPLAIAAGILVARGVGPEAYDDVVRHGRALAADVPPEPNAPPAAIRWLTGNADPSGELPAPFGSTDYLVWWGRGSWPIWLAAVPCLAWLALARRSFGRLVVVGWTVSTLAQVVAPGLYWAHYYLLPVPGLALAVGLTIGDLGRLRRRPWWTKVFGAGLIGAIGTFGAIQVKDYLLVPAEQLTVRYKGGAQWVELRRLGGVLKERTARWDAPRLHVWGWQSPVLFYSGLDAASRHFFTNNLMRDYADRRHPVVSPRIAELMGDLRAERPELVLVRYPPFPALRDFLGEHYLPSSLHPLASDGRGLWVRKDRWAEFEAGVDRLGGDPGRIPRN